MECAAQAEFAEWILDELWAGKQVRGFADVHFCPFFGLR
jgi:hypothetical protein